MEEILGFCVLVLTVLGLTSLAVWFCCTILVNVVKTRRRLKSLRYEVLLRENERLKGFLAEAEEENSRYRRAYRPERSRNSGQTGRYAA